MSLVIYFRHEGLVRDEFSSRFQPLISRASRKRARILGALIRAGHALGVGAPGVLPRVPLRLKNDVLVLKLPKDLSNMSGERVRRRFKILARETGYTFQLVDK